MKLLYYLAAIGNPNYNIKMDILKHNLLKVYESININFDIIINCYETELDILNDIMSFHLSFLDKILIHKKRGILSELWLTNKYHCNIQDYDYIFFILDDVKIHNININRLIDIKLKYNIQFLSPKVIKATWQYMKHPKYKDLLITNRIEVYSILFNPNDFNVFMEMNDTNNPNIWGIDYLMSHLNIRTAVYHKNVVEHCLKSNSNHTLAIEQMNTFLKKYGYSSNKELLCKYGNEIVQIIKDE